MATDSGTVPIEELLAHAGWVREIARRLVRDEATADELVQDTWVAALRSPPPEGRPVRPWLRAVLANFARRRMRGEARRRAREAACARGEGVAAAEELVEEIELQRALAREVLALREPYRTVLLRRFYRGESAARIARATGVPPGTVRSQLDRGLALLRERVERRFGDRRSMSLALAPLLQGAWTVKESSKLVAAAGVAVAALVAAVVGWRALEAPASGARGSGVEPALAAAPGLDPEPGHRVAAAQARDQRVTVAVPPAREPAAAAAPRTTRVVARIVDEAGHPLAGATLGRRQDDPAALESGPDGRVGLELRDEDLVLWGDRQHARVLVAAAPWHATLFLSVTPWRHAETDLGDLVLAPGGQVSGTVVDDTGAPLAGVEVSAADARLADTASVARRSGPQSAGRVPSASTGADGTFELRGVPAGAARVWGAGSDGGWSFTEPLEVRAGEELGGVFLTLVPLEARDRIAGVVLGPDGEPIPGAWLRYTLPARFGMIETAAADAEGRFEIVVQTRQPHDVRAEDPGRRLTPAVERGVEAGTLDLVLRLTEPRWIEVRAFDGAGEPVPGFDARTESDASLAHDPSAAHGSGEEGMLLVRVPRESFRVVVRADGFADGTQGPFDPENAPRSLDFRLEALAGIRGRVVFEGEPVAGATVALHEVLAPGMDVSTRGFRLRLRPRPETSERTDDGGRFHLAVEERHQYVLLVSHDGFATSEWGPVDAGPGLGVEGVEIDLVRGGSIEGEVVPPAGRDRAGLLVSISRGDGDVRMDRTDADGRYRFDALTPGGWQVAWRAREAPEAFHFQSSDGERWEPRWDCIVADGLVTVHDVDLREESLARVTGAVAVDGEPAAGWTVSARHVHAADVLDPVRPVVVGPEGRFELAVVPGTYELTAEAPPAEDGHVSVTRRAEVDDAGLEWSLVLETATLAGSSSGGPRRLTCNVRMPDGTAGHAWITPDEDGSFSLRGVPAGEATIHRVHEDELDPWRLVGRVELVAGETRVVELE